MSTFDYLLRRVESSLVRQNTTMRRSISPEEKLAICVSKVSFLIEFCTKYTKYIS